MCKLGPCYVMPGRHYVQAGPMLCDARQTLCASWVHVMCCQADTMCKLDPCYVMPCRHYVQAGSMLCVARQTLCASWTHVM